MKSLVLLQTSLRLQYFIAFISMIPKLSNFPYMYKKAILKALNVGTVTTSKGSLLQLSIALAKYIGSSIYCYLLLEMLWMTCCNGNIQCLDYYFKSLIIN